MDSRDRGVPRAWSQGHCDCWSGRGVRPRGGRSRSVRTSPIDLDRCAQAGIRPGAGGPSPRLSDGRVRTSRSSVPRSAVLPALLHQVPVWAGLARRESWRQRSRAGPLSMSQGGGVVSRLRLARACSRISSTLTSVRSVRRCLPLFLAARPRTPLRVLCIVAFDARHRLRHAKPLPVSTHQVLAALLDFGACTNAIVDHKPYSHEDLDRSRRILDEAGLQSIVDELLERLWDLETRRPPPFGDDRQCHDVRSHREAVARLWLGTVAATAAGSRCVEDGIRATYADDVLDLLFRIVMQCQIIDDAIDYSRDASAGLPSFLTASASFPDAIDQTYQAACDYARHRDLPRSGDALPFRVALGIASACAKLMIRLSRWRWGGRFYFMRSRTPRSSLCAAAASPCMPCHGMGRSSSGSATQS